MVNFMQTIRCIENKCDYKTASFKFKCTSNVNSNVGQKKVALIKFSYL